MVNDQHANAGYVGYDGYQNGSYETDPLFGTLPGGYEDNPSHNGQYQHPYDNTPYENAPYDSAQWDTGVHTASYDAYGTPQYDTTGQWASVTADTGYQQATDTQVQTAEPDVTGQWDATAWNQANQLNGTDQTGQFENPQFGYDASGQATSVPYDPTQSTQFVTGQFTTGQFETGQFETGQFESGQFENAQFGYEATTQWAAPAFDTGAYDATAWNSAGAAPDPAHETLHPEAVVPEQYHADPSYETGAHYSPDSEYGATEQESNPSGGEFDATSGYASAAETQTEHPGATGSGTEGVYSTEYGAESEPEPMHLAETMATPAITIEPRATRRAGGGNGSRGRRRTPAKRSALLTVAVPSACVMGVAGIAAASVGNLSGGEETQDDTTTTASAADTASSAVQPVVANNKLDTQLAALSADARDFGDRASRTQERIDLKARQEAEKKKREDEAARKEALRPKFALPVAQHGLSAQYGQAGVNWMSMHTGIDFPVSYGTPVMAATDGTVRTQYNSAYGNMAIVTSPDGTETWYCHLSSTKIRSGSVKAGDVIAFSGNSGNSTGPHLHFEVRPGGGAAIDPLSWLRSHGVDPM
ncbi:peptidoglycan DD-metalloendopeptidase family protein [Streptomyces sp. NPDC088116]|uniref:M23 family metallopeptidase n=1 Tax=Streptomyces sp. NPDC088116 TaxID=3365825 RepID=UPI0037F1E337